ncbi:MAG: hypothetical protein WA858_14715 [Xanthobacteraceae bacterium]
MPTTRHEPFKHLTAVDDADFGIVNFNLVDHRADAILRAGRIRQPLAKG